MSEKSLDVGEKYISVQLDDACLAKMLHCVMTDVPCRIAFFPNRERTTKTQPSFKSRWGAVWFQEKKEKPVSDELKDLPEELI